MTERDRLTNLILSTPKKEIVIGGRAQGRTYQTAQNIADHLLANGVTVLPCKVGDIVWWVDTEFEELLKGAVVSFSLQKEGLWAYCRYQGGLTYWHLVSDYFGKTVFLTREEAELK